MPAQTALPPATTGVPDALLAAAVQTAREAAVEVGGRRVGEHRGVHVDAPASDGPIVTHAFATTDRAYVGWHWAVTLARAADADVVTVDEVVLLPGDGALLAPPWVPWSERVEPGDLGTGDLLPPLPDDERLVPSYADPEALLAEQVGEELGLGRARVLSVEGRAEAAERWAAGDAGPEAPRARSAPGRCVDCGFLVLLAGSLRAAFGMCANRFAPDDGRVVALTHGCGAHSETVVDASHAATAGMAVEDDEFDLSPVALPDAAVLVDEAGTTVVAAPPEPAVLVDDADTPVVAAEPDAGAVVDDAPAAQDLPEGLVPALPDDPDDAPAVDEPETAVQDAD